MIPFNKPPLTGNEEKYVLQAMRSDKLSGDGLFGKSCQKWFEEKLGCRKALLTPSCTHALEMAAILIDIQPGDEVIMSSYTFVSTANAFVLRGAKIVFVDIRPDTLNINEELIEVAITEKTKAIVPVHYAGVACEMDAIMQIAERYNLYVIEDAAQGMMSTYKGRQLGTIGHLGSYSFHETKNYTSGGEGGLLIVNDDKFAIRSEVIREKGTNRSQFFRGMVDKYTWVDLGSSYLPSELQSAYLFGQLEKSNDINEARIASWNLYHQSLMHLQTIGYIELPKEVPNCRHNAHMFYIKLKDLDARTRLMELFKEAEILAVFHYIPLHSSPMGQLRGEFSGADNYTTVESERLLRLPMWFGIEPSTIAKVVAVVEAGYAQETAVRL